MNEIKPALTAEEWAELRFRRHDGTNPELQKGVLVCDGAHVGSPDEQHAIAALALHGQPFGFTWEMVDAIRECASETPLTDEWNGRSDLAEQAAGRIAALLPPREPRTEDLPPVFQDIEKLKPDHYTIRKPYGLDE